HADLSHLSARNRVVGVVAHLSGQVERDRESRLALLEKVPKAAIGLRRRTVPGVLSHRPVAVAITLAADPARERELAGLGKAVERADRNVGGGLLGKIRSAAFGLLFRHAPILSSLRSQVSDLSSNPRSLLGTWDLPLNGKISSTLHDRSLARKTRGLRSRRSPPVDG